MPIGPGCFDQDASSSTVPGLGDAATVDLVARGTLRGHEPQVAHKLAWILKAGEITNPGEHSDGSNEIDAAHRLQGRDNLGKRPFEHRLADRLFQTLDAFAFLTHPVQKFFEYHALLTMLELLCHEPLHVGWPPRRLRRINASQPQHQRRDLLALALQILLRCLTGAREIAHGLMTAVRHPHSRELTGARQLGKTDGIAPVRLNPVTRLLGDKRGSNHDALVAEALDQPVEPVSRRPSFVTENQLAVFCRKFGNELSDRRSGGRKLTEIPHLADPAATRNA